MATLVRVRARVRVRVRVGVRVRVSVFACGWVATVALVFSSTG